MDSHQTSFVAAADDGAVGVVASDFQDDKDDVVAVDVDADLDDYPFDDDAAMIQLEEVPFDPCPDVVVVADEVVVVVNCMDTTHVENVAAAVALVSFEDTMTLDVDCVGIVVDLV